MAKQPHRQKSLKSWIGYFFSFLLGILLAFAFTPFLIREKPVTQEDFSQKVSIADQIVNSQFYSLGISKKDVYLEHSLPKREKAITWTEYSLKIKIPRTSSFSMVEEHFKQSISSAGKPFSFDSLMSDRSLQVEVKVMDRMTHHLMFFYPELRAKVAIVIDDLGKESRISREILDWDLPLTLSILPFTPHAIAIASEAHQKSRDVILHLPMEPHGYPKIQPGEGALLEKMKEEEILAQLSKDIESIPYVKGVSNHMGSRLMEDSEKVRIIFSELKRRELFFLDSRTTPKTVGLQTAKFIGLKAEERSLFLDHSLKEEDVKKQIEQLTHLALSKGKAIGIGHPHPSTIKCLREMIPKMQEKGIEIVPLSELIQ